MNDHHFGPDDLDDHPRDLAMITADDELLDLLGAGGAAGDGDEVAAMLAAWRADVAADLPTVRRVAPGAVAAATGHTSVRRDRTRGRAARLLLAAAAGAIVAAGTVAVIARDARPGSPLWPITQVLFAERASAAVAEQDAQRAIDQARQAITDAHYSDAEKLLEEATTRANAVRDPTTVHRLLQEISVLRGLLPGAGAPTTPSDASGGTGGPGGPGGGPGGTGAPTTAPGGLLPSGIVPSGILPTGIVPTGIVPSGILPSSLLPGLP